MEWGGGSAAPFRFGGSARTDRTFRQGAFRIAFAKGSQEARTLGTRTCSARHGETAQLCFAEREDANGSN
jgi:hypothetical protein